MIKKNITSANLVNGNYTVTKDDRNKHLLITAPCNILIPRIATWTLDDEAQVTSRTDGKVSFPNTTATADISVTKDENEVEERTLRCRNASAVIQRLSKDEYLVTGNLVV